MSTLETGVTVADRYQVERRIGSGGSSVVYRARDLMTDARVALKILSDDADEREWGKRFEVEADACARARHPNVIRFVRRGLHGDRPFLIFELLEGGTLAELIARASPMSGAMLASVLRQVAAALAHVHERGLVHRDVKPENVMFDARRDVRLVDFGLAINRCRRHDRRLTSNGSVVGTPEYLSPEQVFGRPIDGRSDVFGLGLIAYEMLTGQLPFDGPPIEVARQNALETPPPMRDRNPAIHIDPALEALVHDMLERSAQNRPRATNVLHALERIADPIPRRPEPRPEQRAPWFAVSWAAALCGAG